MKLIALIDALEKYKDQFGGDIDVKFVNLEAPKKCNDVSIGKISKFNEDDYILIT